MKAAEIRQTFFDYFESKQHKIVPSSPIVVKNDPTLMFTNAGMNQFKDFFLGTKESKVKRIADTQKCLRVSGKHNDLEEVGRDSYHHTMFEMLGNWSFGDYFKQEAIEWAWDLLTNVYKLPKDRLYITVFGGDVKEGLIEDSEAAEFWKNWVEEDRILYCDRKDNFWEMGETGPCGPCSEIHIDLRSDEEKQKVPGKDLVNEDHPLVVEIWNLVFIQFNRKANGTLENLPEKHVDTGMGFERLAMALQGVQSNYDTDIFSDFITQIQKKTGIKYTGKYDDSSKSDIAMRVIVDHIRAVSFAIADGELPSNTGAGYVIRRILRRAVRYYFSFLNIKEPYLHTLIPQLATNFKDVFPELKAQVDFVSKVILEEEKSFLNTLDAGLKRLDLLEKPDNQIPGEQAFELFDTYGFPIDLTLLIASEEGFTVDMEGFDLALKQQKDRARKDAERETGDWQILSSDNEVEFIGYDHLKGSDAKILRYRTVKVKKKDQYQIVLNKTPFYAEGGGQVGDQGYFEIGDEKITVLDTKKENDLIIHYVDKIPSDFSKPVITVVNENKRLLTENNHTATHLLHAALRQVLGTHVQQKGSLVKEDSFRFDFSHFEKMTDEQKRKVENIVNTKIRENIKLEEHRSIPLSEAKSAGAMMLFGEKYGEHVRMITFDKDYSMELCGGCHVDATGKIGVFTIKSESGISAGVRRIEAITAQAAEKHLFAEKDELIEIKSLFKNPTNPVKSVTDLQEENKLLKKELEQFLMAQAGNLQEELLKKANTKGDIIIVSEKLKGIDSKAVKTLAVNLEKSLGDAVVFLSIDNGEKVQLMLNISKSLVESKSLHAGNIIREISKHINGGGGGQPFFATAGGTDATGIDAAHKALEEFL